MESEAQQVEQLKRAIQAYRDRVSCNLGVRACTDPEQNNEDATQQDTVREKANTRE
jgi:hypothetical protein